MTQAPQDVQATYCATIVDQWLLMGLRVAVIAPGSRSTPMALALVAREELQIQVVHDERSAAFVALGVAMATRVPAVVLCTSGTAATHFHAAVVEADLSGIPLIAVTADRPPELQGVGAPQTINQIELYGGVVRAFGNPGVAGVETRDLWRAQAAEWWRCATQSDAGPVHVNLAFREPLVGTAGALPKPIPTTVDAERGDYSAQLEAATRQLLPLLETSRGVIIAGGSVAHELEDARAVADLAAALQWPILADPRSGCRHLPQAVSSFDGLLRVQSFAAGMRPHAVLHLGEPPASKVLGQWLQAGEALHVHVHHQSRVIDPLGVITDRVAAPSALVCAALAPVVPSRGTTTWLSDWLDAEHRAQSAIEGELSTRLNEPAVARVLTEGTAQLVVSSSMPIRDVEWFGAPNSRARVYANRGANGIDGVIATAAGVAIGSGRPTVALVGDIAFCHDQSSLTALAGRSLPLTLVVVDNDGGGIFSFLPQASTLTTARFEQLFGTPHGTNVLAVAAAHGLPGVAATTAAELNAAVDDPEVAVVVVRSSRADNVKVHNRLYAAVAAALDEQP